jgi:hydroxypyruvate isomerase
VVIEALNSWSPAYPTTSSAGAFEVIDRLGLLNVAFLADFYHLAKMNEDVLTLIEHGSPPLRTCADRGRTGPGAARTGELPYREVFKRHAGTVYDGRVGLACRPVGPSAESFGWQKELL